MVARLLNPIRLPDRQDEFDLSSVDVDGQAWDVSCNGLAIAARMSPKPTYDAPPERHTMGFVQWLRRGEGGYPVSLKALIDAAGVPEEDDDGPCGACHGSGWSWDRDGACECDNCQCDRCYGSGKERRSPPSRYAKIANIEVNANLVAVTLAALGIHDEETVTVYPDRQQGMLRIFGADWMALIMGLRPGSVKDDAPCYLTEIGA